MNPILTQALAGERIREWRDQAARNQLVNQARRARHDAVPTAAERPWRPARRTAAPPAAAGGLAVAAEGCPPAGDRAA